MPSITTASFYLLLVLAISIQYFLPSPKTNMTSLSTPWADTPCELITTPQHATGKTDIFTVGATHMAHIHNAILRGYNSIYLQAPHVKDADKAAFVGYALTWFRFVKSHHDDEEAELFPAVEQVLNDKNIWGETHKEHESFLQGLSEYSTYLSTLPSPTALNGTHLQSLMSSFQPAFSHHFHSEISTIAALATHPFAPAPNTPEADAAATVFKSWGKKTVMKAGTLDVVPFFLMNLDAAFEEGKWADWPPMPRLVRWGLVNAAGSVYGAWWKFASCDASGRPRDLWALQQEQGGVKE
ncbi:hypothetical protein COCC4DRAFT_159721 [Bipolaris maydis ATCC 48331]|nr:uncharacterized protein COCC4DRAFT_159721 [Bipolaris maydis ATCC 48331]KAJ5023627.1 hypothetical protein J3E73DRAFT_237401 [Bipolaris maydis]ENI09232.1 hypothetical protein COCC4DRAFT_159721 [Bipolaris maydis ATCC 48331]KAJ5058429.1 hypothetical protein J3E74DRAFT_360291 [Bipolaris maydis]KAJ6195671.1 hypothetical protein J3E72DRAFT_339136 [Bipolaris maydis]KAJ6206459.1 hypothetical protein PSV09DRAFT_2224084 [Bipolaris maydis]